MTFSLISLHADVISIVNSNTFVVTCYASLNEPLYPVVDTVSQILNLILPNISYYVIVTTGHLW